MIALIRVDAGAESHFERNPLRPLWFVGAAFVHTRRAGGLLVLGLLLNALLPIRLPWL